MESVMAQEAQHLAEEARIRFGRRRTIRLIEVPGSKFQPLPWQAISMYALQHVTQPDPLAVVLMWFWK